MGAGCGYRTLWADGFSGILPHIENRAGFVAASPDEPAAQQKFKIGRGWRFRMMSHRGTSFAEDGSRYSSNKVEESAACHLTKAPPPRWVFDGGGFLRRRAGNADGRDALLQGFRQTVGDDFAALQHQGNAF